MNVDQHLQTLCKSLEVTTPNPTPKQEKAAVTDALMQIPKLVKALETFETTKRQELDTIKIVVQHDLNIQKALDQSTKNLTKIDELTKLLQVRINQFDQTEAVYKATIKRINNVLDELERVLKQL